MSITVDWDNPEKTVIRFKYDGSWTLTDYFAANEQSVGMMDNVDHKVHIIIDVTESKILPNGVISQGRSAANRGKHHNQGTVMIVGANGLIRGMFDIFKKLYGRNFDVNGYAFASTLDEAYKSLGVPTVTAQQPE
ncbi:MAG: hypothetical protein R3E39_12555 [Anaerolineae bacterium]